MGLQCSRQGYIQDFHELQESRLGPEGECFPTDLTKINRNASLTTQQLEHRLSALLQDDKLAKRLSASLCLANISLGERGFFGSDGGNCATDLLVNLPPEGKACSGQDFVELPPTPKLLEKKGVSESHLQLVQIPSINDDDVDCVEAVENSSTFPECIDLPSKPCDSPNHASHNEVSSRMTSTDDDVIGSDTASSVTSRVDSNEEDEEEWMYSLYDFQENGIVTKQDVNRLMDSICSAVAKSLVTTRSPSFDHMTMDQQSRGHRRASSNEFKVHLEIGQCKKNKRDECQRKKSEMHSSSSPVGKHNSNNNHTRDKYHTSKRYNGLIFPPPNSEEATKVSNYIENKILSYRRLQEDSERPKKRTSSRTNCSLMKTCRTCSQNNNHHHHHHHDTTNQSLSSNSSRHHHRAGTTKPLVHRQQQQQQQQHRAKSPVLSNSFSYNRLAAIRRSNSCDVTNSGDVSNSDSNSLSPPSSTSGSDTPSLSADDVFIGNSQQHRTFSNELQLQQQNLVRFNHACSCTQHKSKQKLKGCENIFAPKQHHDDERVENTERTQVTTTTKTVLNHQHHHHEIKKSSNSLDNLNKKSSSSASSPQATQGGRNAHRKKCRRHTTTNETPPPMMTQPRPEVWPGRAASVSDESTCSPLPANDKDVVPQLCFCKRMLGLDYPCNHKK